MTSTRQHKASENIRKALLDIFNQGEYISDFLFEKRINIGYVSVSPDLMNVKAGISPSFQQNEEDVLKIVEELNAHTYKIRPILAKKLYFKKVPELHFKTDFTYKNTIEIEELLKSLV